MARTLTMDYAMFRPASLIGLLLLGQDEVSLVRVIFEYGDMHPAPC